MLFPVTIHERIAPGTDPNNPNGVYEAVHKQIPFKTLKKLKQAVQIGSDDRGSLADKMLSQQELSLWGGEVFF